MVAMIHVCPYLRRRLYYNEQKVAAGHALLLEAGYYPMDAQDMNFHQKLARLEKLTELNQWSKCNSVHISLSFDPAEKLSAALLIKLSEFYLERIGFAGQPYLLYQHFDAGHPHIHLVTTKIKHDGKAIRTHNLAKNESPKACREIEDKYDLVRADGRGRGKLLRPESVNAERILYGKTETTRAIEQVLHHVLKNYKFSSITQLNAVLRLYNLTAHTGSAHSRMRQNGGLIYYVLDDRGKQIGVPVKASALLGKPTLKVIYSMIAENEASKARHRARLRNAISLALLSPETSLSALRNVLQKDGIDLVFSQGAVNPSAELVYVDHIQKVVFSANELGIGYDAASILKRCRNDLKISNAGMQLELKDWEVLETVHAGLGEGNIDMVANPARVLLDPGYQPEKPDWQLRRRRKKRKKQVVQPT